LNPAPAGSVQPPAPPPEDENPFPLVLPREFAWLVRRLGYFAVGYGERLNYLLMNEPEFAAILAASPKLACQIRSLFWMLGIKPPPDLLPPRRRQPPPDPSLPAAGPPAAGLPAAGLPAAGLPVRAQKRRANRRRFVSGWRVPAEPPLDVNYAPPSNGFRLA
jgi:hypothetical protein